MQQAGTGDRVAFDALVRATAPPVWTLLRRLTIDEPTAEDAMQDTFSAVWQSAPRYAGDGSARAFIYGIARRQAARTWRRRAGEPRHTEPLSELALAAGWGADPEATAARAEERERLLQAIAALSDGDQHLLSRCDLEGATPAEVAAEQELPPGTVRVRLHRARLRLMGALNRENSHE